MAVERVRVFAVGELLPGELTYVDIEGLPLALANVAGQLYAIGDSCRHQGGPLSAGLLVGETVTCPWHGWVYDLRSGKSIVPPVGLRVPTYPVIIVGDDVFVEIDWPD